MTVIRTGARDVESGGMSVPGVVPGRTRAMRRGRRPPSKRLITTCCRFH